MKIFKISLSLILATLIFIGCTPNVSTTVTPEQSPTQETQSGGIDMYADGTGTSLLVGIDQFGRVLSPKTSDDEEKTVGMFYWLWHGSYVGDKIVDTSKIIEEFGLDYALHNVHEYNPNMSPHYWGEPIYGYYDSDDEYVIRKHLEMLSYAGVDYIMFDASNTITYPSTVRKICMVILDMQKEGLNPPKISYYTHTASIQTVLQAYNEIYKNEKYRDTWFMMDGKPLMVAQIDPFKDGERTRWQHAHLSNYYPDPLPQEILDFFTFRTPAWAGQDGVSSNGWPWVDWNFPPQLYGNMVCLSPAVHNWCKFSWAATPEDQRPDAAWCNGRVSWGRGYSISQGKNISEDATQGTFYQSVWNSALNRKDKVQHVFIDGWNEFFIGVEYNAEYDIYETYDSFNMEFSRDLEPIKGGYEDAFLMQTAINARAFLSDEEKDKDITIKTPVKKTIDINGDISAWDGVDAVYKGFGSDNGDRKFTGALSSIKYVEQGAQNVPESIKITADKDNIYMLITCYNDINLSAENSMNVFIGTGTPELKGWESYEYVINRERTGNTASIMSLDAEGNTKVIGNASLKVSGKTMQLAISKSALNMQNDTFYFKVADSVVNINDIMDYYVTGRSVPMGRFSYQYLG